MDGNATIGAFTEPVSNVVIRQMAEASRNEINGQLVTGRHLRIVLSAWRR